MKKMYRMRTLIKVMIVVLPIVGLVGASNLSTAIIILSIAVVLIFVASPKYGQFIFLGAAGQDLWESFLLWRVIGWNGLQSGRIRKLMKRDIRHCKGSVSQLGVEDYLEEGWDRVFKSWDLYRKPRMI